MITLFLMELDAFSWSACRNTCHQDRSFLSLILALYFCLTEDGTKYVASFVWGTNTQRKQQFMLLRELIIQSS